MEVTTAFVFLRGICTRVCVLSTQSTQSTSPSSLLPTSRVGSKSSPFASLLSFTFGGSDGWEGGGREGRLTKRKLQRTGAQGYYKFQTEKVWGMVERERERERVERRGWGERQGRSHRQGGVTKGIGGGSSRPIKGEPYPCCLTTGGSRQVRRSVASGSSRGRICVGAVVGRGEGGGGRGGGQRKEKNERMNE